MARAAPLRRGGGGPGDGLAGAELAHVRVAPRHALRSRADREQGALGPRAVAPDALHGSVLAGPVDAADRQPDGPLPDGAAGAARAARLRRAVPARSPRDVAGG